MGRIGINYSDVSKAINKLQGEQKKPTVDNIRLVLCTGSKSTIAKFLREWKAKNSIHGDESAEIPIELINLVKNLWHHLQDKAEKKSTEYQQQADMRVAEIKQQLKQLQDDNSQAQTQIHNLDEKCHIQAKEAHQLQNQLNSEQNEKTKMIEQIKSLELRHQENQDEKDKLLQFLNHLQDNLEHYQSTTQQLRQEQNLLLDKQRNEYDHKISMLHSEITTINNEKSEIKIKHNYNGKILCDLQQEYDAISKQYQKLSKENQRLSIAHEVQQKEYSQLMTKHQHRSDELNSKFNLSLELQIKLDESKKEIEALNEVLLNANNKIDLLRSEKNDIAHERSHLEGELKQMTAALARNQSVAA